MNAPLVFELFSLVPEGERESLVSLMTDARYRLIRRDRRNTVTALRLLTSIKPAEARAVYIRIAYDAVRERLPRNRGVQSLQRDCENYIASEVDWEPLPESSLVKTEAEPAPGDAVAPSGHGSASAIPADLIDVSSHEPAAGESTDSCGAGEERWEEEDSAPGAAAPSSSHVRAGSDLSEVSSSSVAVGAPSAEEKEPITHRATESGLSDTVMNPDKSHEGVAYGSGGGSRGVSNTEHPQSRSCCWGWFHLRKEEG